MSLPYAALAAAAAVALAVLGSGQAASRIGIGAALVAVASVLSLNQWRANQSSALMTLVIGGEYGG